MREGYFIKFTDASKIGFMVLLVSPPSMAIKPPPASGFKGLFPALTSQHPPINTGLLAVASDIFTYDRSVEIIDGVSEEDYQSRLRRKIREGTAIVGVGVQSGYEYLEALEIARLVKETDPQTTVIFGGQHCAPLGEKIFRHSPHVDAVGIGQGEAIFRRLHQGAALEEVEGLITRERPTGVFGPQIGLDLLGPLRHELNPNYRSYTPYVEDSRGCQYHCMFCTNDIAFQGRIDIRGLASFQRDLEHVVELYGTEQMIAILASNFGVDPRSTLAKASLLKSHGVIWTTELRMDSPWERYLAELYDAGLRILTSGMESASPEILSRMRKTGDTRRYLEKASGLLKAARRFPELVVKISYMIYVGESRRSLADTISFLQAHRDYLDGALLTPTFIIEGTPLWDELQDRGFLEETGFQFIQDDYWAGRGIYFGNLSRDISYEDALEISKTMESRFTNQRADRYYRGSHERRLEKGAKNLWKDRFKE